MPIWQAMNSKPVFELVVLGRPQRWMRPAQGTNPATGQTYRFTDPQARDHKTMVAELAREKWRRPYLLGPVALSVQAVFKPWANMTAVERAALGKKAIYHDCDPDLDQIVKQVQDAITEIVYEDDCQVSAYTNCLKRYGKPERTVIKVYELDQPEGVRTSRMKRLDKKFHSRLI